MEDRDRVFDYTKHIKLFEDNNKVRKNFTQGYFHRAIGRYKNAVPSEFQWAAEDNLILKSTYEELKCQLPDSPRSTFLMVFSPDGKKVASTHGNHNVYVTDLTTGKNIQTLSGHPRTPWCIAFHPSSNQILASGCLGGQVRVWDLHGGSEVWTAESQTVIASLAFHPFDRMLVIATYNELHFWDWSQPEPFAKCSTKSEREKVRYVSFDRLGNKLITGIANPVNVPSQWDRVNIVNNQAPSTSASTTLSFSGSSSSTIGQMATTTQSVISDQGRSITFCYRHLMNQYNQLVTRYFDLSRPRITSTIDRGTDPMDLIEASNSQSESDVSVLNSSTPNSNSNSNSNSSLRFRINRAASRSYRPLNHNRERFRIHSSIFNRANNRSFASDNSPPAASTTNSTFTLVTRNSIFTTPATFSSLSNSSHTTPRRLRRCALSLGVPAYLNYSSERGSNLFFSRNTLQSTSTAGAVTNPTYTSIPENGIFSTRENNSNDFTRPQFSAVHPQRVSANYLENNHSSGNESLYSELVGNMCGSQSLSRGSTSRTEEGIGSRRLGLNTILNLPGNCELRKEPQRFISKLHPKKQRTELSNSSGHNSSICNNSMSNESCLRRRASRLLSDLHHSLRNLSPERRLRENESFERSLGSFESRRTSLSQSLMHPQTLPRFQGNSRFQRNRQSQMHLITNRETHGFNLQNNQNLRRQLLRRPEGQFVLSRHFNSPLQQRVSQQLNDLNQSNNLSTSFQSTSQNLRIENSTRSNTSSFINSMGFTPSTRAIEGNGSSPTSVASNLSFTGNGASRQLREHIKTRLFDRVKTMLKDRIRNSSDLASIDSTVNYSRITGESEADAHSALDSSLESDDLISSNVLGPRGVDPLLSSVSENNNILNNVLVPTNEDSSSLPHISNRLTVSNDFNIPPNESGLLDSWESGTQPTSLNLDSSLFLNDILNGQSQESLESDANLHGNQETENTSTSGPGSSPTSSSHSDFSMEEGIQLLSIHIQNMQRLCKARVEILQRQKIRRIWEDLTNQLREFRNIICSRNVRSISTLPPQNDDSNLNNNLFGLRDLTINSSLNLSESSEFSVLSLNSRYRNVISEYKELVQNMVNELFGNNNSVSSNTLTSNQSVSDVINLNDSINENSQVPNCIKSSRRRNSRNESDEPQPGPSGISSSSDSRGERLLNKKNDDLKLRFYNLIIETLQRERRRFRRSTVVNSGSGFYRHNNYHRLRNPSRFKFRSHRNGRRNFDSFVCRSRSFNRELEAFLNLKREEINIKTSLPVEHETSDNVRLPAVSVSLSKTSGSSNACHSCGQKKKINTYYKRKEENINYCDKKDSENETSEFSSNLLKNNRGCSETATKETSNRNEIPSTSAQASTSYESQDNSTNTTNDLLKQMIQTMETMLRFLREAFHRTEEFTRERSTRQQQLSLHTSGEDSDSDQNNRNEQNEESIRNLPKNFRSTREIILNLIRDVSQLRAKKLLGFMVKILTRFCDKNFGNLIEALDEQLISLYMLLHLALELTDLLLEQLNSRSRELERDWTEDNESVRIREIRTRNLLLSRSYSVTRRIRERCRNTSRNSYSYYTSSRQDNLRFRKSSIPLLTSRSQLLSFRVSNSDPSSSVTCDWSSRYSNFLKGKRSTSRVSTSLSNGGSTRYSRITSQLRASNSSLPTSTRRLNSTISQRSFRYNMGSNIEDSRVGISPFNCLNNQVNTDINSNNSFNIGYKRQTYNNNSTSRHLNNNIDNSGISSNANNNVNDDDNDDDDDDDDEDDNDNVVVVNDNNINNNSNSRFSDNLNDIAENNNNNNNFLNIYFPHNNTSSSDGSSSINNNIILVTGLNNQNDLLNNRVNSSMNSTSNSSERNSRRQSESNPFFNQTLPPLRQVELTLSRNEDNDLSMRDEQPIFWIRYGGNNEPTTSNNNESPSRGNTFTVPIVQVNDIPVSDVSMLNEPRQRPQSPVPRAPEDIWRWRAWRPRFLHPRYSGPNPFEDQDTNDVPDNIHYYRIPSTTPGFHLGLYALDPMIITDAPLSPHHRIQAWDFSKMDIPDISDREANGVVPECKIHNDASVDVSKDGHLLVTLLPSGRLSITTMLGVYSLDWTSLGQLLYRTSFEQNAVSVSLSPTNRHLLVGLASRPIIMREKTNMAQIFRLEGGKPSPHGGSWQSGRGRLVHMRDLEQTRESNIMSLNCIRWAPGAGQGLVYGTNTGQLKVLR